MAIQPLFTADAPTLRRVVSELRWLLARQPDLRGGLARIVRRYENDLAETPPRSHPLPAADHRHTDSAVQRRVIPFRRNESRSIDPDCA